MIMAIEKQIENYREKRSYILQNSQFINFFKRITNIKSFKCTIKQFTFVYLICIHIFSILYVNIECKIK